MGISAKGIASVQSALSRNRSIAPGLARKATKAGARVLQSAQKRHARVRTGHFRSNIILKAFSGNRHGVVVPRRRFPSRFFYPIQFLRTWHQVNRQYRSRALRAMRRVLKAGV